MRTCARCSRTRLARCASPIAGTSRNRAGSAPISSTSAGVTAKSSSQYRLQDQPRTRVLARARSRARPRSWSQSEAASPEARSSGRSRSGALAMAERSSRRCRACAPDAARTNRRPSTFTREPTASIRSDPGRRIHRGASRAPDPPKRARDPELRRPPLSRSKGSREDTRPRAEGQGESMRRPFSRRAPARRSDGTKTAEPGGSSTTHCHA
jgi:hypothetical protein